MEGASGCLFGDNWQIHTYTLINTYTNTDSTRKSLYIDY
jgi:hypothetical protein